MNFETVGVSGKTTFLLWVAVMRVTVIAEVKG
jgi:hypothetical protein